MFQGDSIQVPGTPPVGDVANTKALRSVEETQHHTEKQAIKK